MRKILLALFLLFIATNVLATTFYSQGSVAAQTAGNWNTSRVGGGTAAVSGDFTAAGNIFVIQGAVANGGGGASNHAMTLGGTLTIGSGSNNTKLQIEGGGSLTATSALTIAAAGQFQLDAGATYNHNQSGAFSADLGGIESFASTSTFAVMTASGSGPTTGPTSSQLTGSFGNFTFTSSNTMQCNDVFPNVAGNLTMNGSGEFRMAASTAGNGSFTIGGDLIISGAGIFSFGNGTVKPNLGIGGNFNMSSGTLLAAFSSAGTSTINFTKSGTATFTKTGGTITAVTSSSRAITFSVANGTTLDFGTNVLDAANTSTINFTLNNGAGLITANTGGISAANAATGSVQNLAGTRTFNTGANYTFNGSSAQVTGTGLTGANNLTINNSNTGVTLTSATSVSGILTLTLGAFSNGSNLTMANNATISRANGSLASVPTFGTNVDVTYTGSTSDINTGNELPVSATVLRNLTINQSTNTVSLNADAKVNTLLTFTAGNLKLGNNTLTIGSSASISGATSAKYVMTNGSGSLKMNVPATNTNITFPIGTATRYNPIILNNNGGTADDYSIKLSSGAPANTANANTNYVQNTWTIAEGVDGGSNLTLTTQWNASSLNSQDEGSTYNHASTKIGRYTGTGTTYESFAATVAGSNPYTAAQSAGTFTTVGTSGSTFITGNFAVLATEPTTQSAITFGAVTNNSIVVNFSGGDGSKRIVVARSGSDPSANGGAPVDATTYTDNAAFGSGTQIGTNNYVVYAGAGNTVTVTGLSTVTTYYFAVYEYSDNNTSGQENYLTTSPGLGNKITLSAEPTSQPSGLSFTSVTPTGMTINWSGNGDGAKRIVVVKSGSAVDADPVDGTTYTANTVFGSGTQIGTGNRVVYANNGSSVVVTGMSAGTTYHVALYEFNGSAGSENYLQTSPLTGNQATSAVTTPTVTTTAISAITISAANSGGNVTSDGGDAITERGIVYGTSINPTTSDNKVTDGATTTGSYSSNLSGLSTNTTYHVRAYAINNQGTSYGSDVSFTTLAAEPATAGTVSFGTRTDGSLVVNFTGGDGGRRIVVARSGSAVNFIPTDGTLPAGIDADFSAATNQSNGNKVVYDGTGSTVTVTGLTKNTTYHFAVYEYNNNTATSPNFYATAGTGSQATYNPTISATGTLSFGTVATGSSSTSQSYYVSGTELVSSITVTRPSALFEISLDDVDYSQNPITLLRNGSDAVGSTQIYVRFSPSSADGSHSGNVDNTATNATTKSVAVSGTAITAEPTIIGSISFSNVGTTSLEVNLPAAGNGASRIIVVKQGGAPTAPTDGTTYTAQAAYGSGSTTAAGSYVVYKGSGSGSSLVTVTGLTQSTSYTFTVYEYNGSGGTENYLTSSSASASQTTTDATLSTDYFRSAVTGDWSANATWQSSHDGSNNWISATATPTSSATSVNILSGHNVTIATTPTTIGNTDVNSGGTLTVTIATLTIASGKTCTINGTLDNTSTNGTPITATGNFNIASGGNYIMDGAGGTMPQISGTLTYSTGSTLTIGKTPSASNPNGRIPSSGSAPFNFPGNVVWDDNSSPSISTNMINSTNNAVQVSGNFTMKNGIAMAGNGGTARTLTVLGNLIVQGGELDVKGHLSSGDGTGTFVMTISGNVTVSGGVFYTVGSGNAQTSGGGTLNVGGTLSHTAGSFGNNNSTMAGTVVLNGSSAQTVSTAGLTATGINNVTISNSSGVSFNTDISVNGALAISGGNLSIASAKTLTLASGSTCSISSGKTFTIDGTAINSTTTAWTVTGSISVSNGGKYQHNINGGTIPTATWVSGSTCEITGVTATAPSSGLGQSFHHFTWNCPNQSAASALSGNLATVLGDLNITDCGSIAGTIRDVRLNTNATSITTTVSGNLVIGSNGQLAVINSGSNNTGAGVLTVNGNATISGKLDLTGSSAFTATSSTVNFKGNVTISGSGTIVRTQTTPSTINLIKASGTQTFTSTAGGINTNTIIWNVGTGSTTNTVQLSSNFPMSGSSTLAVLNNAILNCGTNVISSGSSVTVNNGGTLQLGSTSNSGALEANVTTSTITLNSGSAVEYNGNAAQYAATRTYPSGVIVKINNSNGVTVTGGDVTVNGTLNLTSGNITTSSNKVIIGSSGSVSRTSGHVAGNLQKSISAAGTTTFEIGDASNYRPAAVNFGSTPSSSGTLTASVTQSDGSHSAISTAGLYLSKVLKRYWTLTNSGIAGTYSATFTFVSGDVPLGATATNFVVKKYNGSVWSATTTGTQTSTSTQATGLTSFSDFILGETNADPTFDNSSPQTLTVCQGASATSINNLLTASDADGGQTLTWTVSASPSHGSIGGGGATASSGTSVTPAGLTYTPTGGYSGSDAFTIQVSDGSATASMTVNVTVSPTSVGGTIAGSATVCSNSNSGTLTLSGHTGTIVKWQYSNDNFSSDVHDIVNATTSQGYSGLAETTYYRAVVQSNACASANSSVATVTVNTAINITVQPATTTVCSGATSFSVTATGTSPTYQWQVSTNGGANFNNLSNAGIYSTVTTNTLNISDVTGLNNYQYRAVVSGTSPCGSVNSNAATLMVGNTWTGATNNDWNTSTNWQCGSVPISSDNVFIPNVTIKPVLSGSVSIGDIMINSGSTLNIGVGNTLTISGAVSGSGTISGSTTSNLIIGAAAGTLNFTPASNTLENLTLNSSASATLGSTLNITGGASFGTVAVANGATLNTGGYLVLKSDINGTARVDELGTGVINGNVTAERFVGANTPKRAWRLLSSPIEGTTIYNAWQDGGANNSGYGTLITGSGAGFDAGNASIKTWNGSAWVTNQLGNTNSGNIASYQGYMVFVRGDRSVGTGVSQTPTNTTVRPIGSLRQGTMNNYVTVPASAGYTLMGNPYASAIDFEAIHTDNTALVNFYAWDPNQSGNYGVGAYNLVERTGAGTYDVTPQAGGSSNNNSARYIPQGVAVLLQNPGSLVTVTMKESYKTSNTTTLSYFRNANGGDMNLAVNLATTVSQVIDGVRVRYDAAYNNNATAEDIAKLYNNNENISIGRTSQFFIVEKRAALTQNDTIFLRLTGMKQQGYQLIFYPANFSGVSQAYVEDSYLNTSTAISLVSNTTINFTVDANAASTGDRFRIVFRPSTPLPVTFTSIRAYEKSGTVQVEWNVTNESGINGYEVERSINGREFSKVGEVSAKGNNNSRVQYSFTDGTPVNGNNYYRVKSVSADGQLKYTSVVRVNPGKGGTVLTVYPNPVKGETITLQLNNLEKGVYTVRLINTAGQVVLQQQLQYGGGAGSEQINLPPGLSRGNYRLEVSGTDNRFTRQIVLQ